MKLYKSLISAEKDREEVQALKISIKGGKFPVEILDFSNLTELYLDGDCNEFPTEAPEWKKLKILSIKWQNFNGDLSSIFKLPNLENLKIIDTPLTTFFLPLGHAPAPVKSITIKDCGLKALPEELAMLWQLNELNLSGNNLTKLPYSFVDLTNLKRLNLDSNKFEIFPDSIKLMPKLTHLSIDNNAFAEEEKERIQREFHIWPN
jgi:Leucine-rich repeat (LRR) protein